MKRISVRGFLLVEVLLAVTILAVSLGAVSYALLSTYRNLASSRDYSIALFLLESKMAALSQNKSFQCLSRETGRFENPFERFWFTLESSLPRDQDHGTHLCEATLSVSWPSGKRDRSLSVVVYKYGQKDY